MGSSKSRLPECGKSASISKCGRYRYMLTRRWNGVVARPRWLCFIGLNPSIADHQVDDPTIRRCIGFGVRDGYDGIIMLNLFGLIDTNPGGLKVVTDPVGPHFDDIFQAGLIMAETVVAAWGAHPHATLRQFELVRRGLINRPLMCLGVTKSGHPKHPLYLRSDTPLVRYWSPSI